MKTIYLSATAALVLLLSACAGDHHAKHAHHGGHNHKHAHHGMKADHHHGMKTKQQNANTAVFKCDNGSDVLVNYQSGNRIVIAYGKGSQRDILPLNHARAASGELYVSADKKTEWHQKNGEAVFDRTDSQGKTVTLKCSR